MTTISEMDLLQNAADDRYAVMKKTAVGPVDICNYHKTIGSACLALMDLPAGEYEIVRIRETIV